ncbi:hypothetical protein UFOVP1204_16 [uncultured Caudovirales phage]|uniref:Uncharacterized protein n=1 Tax=uncultured Caudovirales phage TaxID=2100421 RepID=A0A6J5R0M5_9CAUD|nr:hypothetical protein UFOVP473_11 [uncultured Caudovirales phage]CAB4176250.1 hypothetical protein UFOVP983_11 [uncultured Caudovirales phage]CAB4189612.1 hypothetical protein UFOVP1204_16 [uncultured Caudovirales phage]
MKLELSKEEAQVLVNLINAAVKSAGLEAAESGLHFYKMIQNAVKIEDVEANAVDTKSAVE